MDATCTSQQLETGCAIRGTVRLDQSPRRATVYENSIKNILSNTLIEPLSSLQSGINCVTSSGSCRHFKRIMAAVTSQSWSVVGKSTKKPKQTPQALSKDQKKSFISKMPRIEPQGEDFWRIAPMLGFHIWVNVVVVKWLTCCCDTRLSALMLLKLFYTV